MSRSLVHMAARFGHRREYLELFADTLELEPSVGKVGLGNLITLIHADRLLFGSLDDDYLGFFLVTLLRTAIGKRTAGLFIRPQTCFLSSSLRYKAKKAAFRVLKHLSTVSVFTIVPFSTAPHYALVADSGLVDPQMWDKLDSEISEPDAKLASQILAAATGRRVLAFIGTVNAIKGIGFLRNLMSAANWPTKEILVVVAGHFPDELLDVAHTLESQGAMVLARTISDAELLALYDQADFVWACYRSDYDQASGIFGRAVQFAKTPIVRAGSLVALFARQNGISALELDCASPGLATNLFAKSASVNTPGLMAKMSSWKRDFIKNVGGAL